MRRVFLPVVLVAAVAVGVAGWSLRQDESGDARAEPAEHNDDARNLDEAAPTTAPEPEPTEAGNSEASTKPKLPVQGAAVTRTTWMAKQGAKCPAFEGFQPVAIAVDVEGRVWLADDDEIIRATEYQCAFTTITTGYEGRGNAVAGMVALPGRGIVASYIDGQVVRIDGHDVLTELMEGVPGGSFAGDHVSTPALFPDGSIAVVRVEGEGAKAETVLYRITEGSPPTPLATLDVATIFAPLVTVPGPDGGVALFDIEANAEVLHRVDGKGDGAVLPGPLMALDNCRVYVSTTERWEYWNSKLVHITGAGEVEHEIEGVTEPTGCMAAALSPDGKSFWYVTELPGALYEVRLPE